MKESYTKPDITVVEFKAIDVITTSDPTRTSRCRGANKSINSIQRKKSP